MTTKVLNKLVNVCTTLSGGTTTSGTSSSTVSKEFESTSDTRLANVYRLLNLESGKINKFEGVITGTYTTANVYFKVYMNLVSYDEILINPIFERLETTYSDHLVENCYPYIDLKKFTASDGSLFIGLEGFGFNELTIDIITGDSDVITEVDDVQRWDSVSFISTDRNYQGRTSNGYTSLRITVCSCCDFDQDII